MQTEVQKIKDSSLKAWVHPLGGLRGRGGGGRCLNLTISENVMLHIKLKGMSHAST